jgi:hypothetical protein
MVALTYRRVQRAARARSQAPKSWDLALVVRRPVSDPPRTPRVPGPPCSSTVWRGFFLPRRLEAQAMQQRGRPRLYVGERYGNQQQYEENYGPTLPQRIVHRLALRPPRLRVGAFGSGTRSGNSFGTDDGSSFASASRSVAMRGACGYPSLAIRSTATTGTSSSSVRSIVSIRASMTINFRCAQLKGAVGLIFCCAR